MNNYNKIRKLRERVLETFYPVYHAPLIFDIGTQRCYRKPGYVAWPKSETPELKPGKEERQNERAEKGAYFAYPKHAS